VLIQAHVARARLLAIAVPNAFLALRMMEIARQLNPGIDTVAYIHSEDEAALLRKQKIGRVFMDAHELASGMSRHVIERAARGAAIRPETG
jgi:CPA2 family monovalent cation:H+ antiporter-2